MSNKSKTFFCFSCEAEGTIKYSAEDTKIIPEFCPFCGDSLDNEEFTPEDEQEEEEEEQEW
jgi:hypothetical protein